MITTISSTRVNPLLFFHFQGKCLKGDGFFFCLCIEKLLFLNYQIIQKNLK
ncbi:MAG: hypothetical protein Q8S84_02845 [bacterium]|nr:hypothetical protein [bacterium]